MATRMWPAAFQVSSMPASIENSGGGGGGTGATIGGASIGGCGIVAQALTSATKSARTNSRQDVRVAFAGSLLVMGRTSTVTGMKRLEGYNGSCM